MRKEGVIVLAALFLISTQGCRWQDDFRAREQPYYLQQPQNVVPAPRPTLNKDSEDYQGNDLNKKEEDEKSVSLKSIDNLSQIPEVPEYPAGI